MHQFLNAISENVIVLKFLLFMSLLGRNDLQ